MKARMIVSIALATAACGSSPKEPASPSKPEAAVAAPAPTGRIIEIGMHTDENGNYFLPADVEAKPGDVLRYTLVTGVHNVNFLPDSNPGAANLPPASDMLQLPGQTHDVIVTMGPGKHFYQCDPHAALGMVGHVTVEP